MAEPETKAPTTQEPVSTNPGTPESAKGDTYYAYAAEKVSALSNYFLQQYYVHLAATLTLQQAEDIRNLAFLHYTNAKERYESLRDKTSKILNDAKLNADQKREQLNNVTQGAFTATQVKLAEWQKWSAEGLEKAQSWAVDKAQVLLKQAEEQYSHAVRQYEDIKRRTLENMGVSSAAISEIMTVESLRNQAWAQYHQASERVHQLRDATAVLLADTRLTAEQKREQIRTLAADLFKATQDKAGEWQVWASAPVEKAQQWVIEKAEEVRKQAEERYSQAVVRYEEMKKRTLDTTGELSLQRADELKAQAFALYQQARERYESLKGRLAKIFEDTQLGAEAKREKILQVTTDAFLATSVRAEELKKWGSESVEKARQWALDTAQDLLKKAEEQYHQAIARYEDLKKKTLEGAKALHSLTLQKAEELKVQASASLQQAKDRYENLKSATQKILDDAKLTAEQKREQLGQIISTTFQTSQVRADEWKKWGSESLEKARCLAIEKAEELTKQAEEQYNNALQRYEEMKKTTVPPTTYTEQLTGAVGTAAAYTYNWVGDVLGWALGRSASPAETKTGATPSAS